MRSNIIINVTKLITVTEFFISCLGLFQENQHMKSVRVLSI